MKQTGTTLKYLAFGLLFGFILSRVDATNYDAIVGMFLFEDLHLAGVIGIAILVSAPILWILRKKNIAGPNPEAKIQIQPKARKSGNFIGGLLFGTGWAITGSCPGPALAQIGEGKVTALFIVLGIFMGTVLYQKVGINVESFLSKPRAKSKNPNAMVADSIRPHSA